MRTRRLPQTILSGDSPHLFEGVTSLVTYPHHAYLTYQTYNFANPEDLSTEAKLENSIYREALAKISEKRAKVGVIGLGYVGLPICLALSRVGFRTIGFDVDQSKPEMIRSGRSYIKHVDDVSIKESVQSGLLDATCDLARLVEVDIVLVCVPTPLDTHLAPDLSYVVSTCRSIAQTLAPGKLVILESTTYPGTTSNLLSPIFEERGFEVGVDVFLAFSPEREDPGNADFMTTDVPKVVGADDDHSRLLASRFYEKYFAKIVNVSSAATAEAVKITENVFRAVNIALANELKVIFSELDVDIWEVIEAAKTKPFGYMPFYPGPGLGGHCIPIDPFYLSWRAKEVGLDTRFIELAGQINRSMPRRVVSVLAEALSTKKQLSMTGARLLLLGLGYKKNVDDIRESPSLELIKLMKSHGANVDYYDPFVPEIPKTRNRPELTGMVSVKWDLPAFQQSYDAIIIATDHDLIDFRRLGEECTLVIDTRNACAKAGITGEQIVPA